MNPKVLLPPIPYPSFPPPPLPPFPPLAPCPQQYLTGLAGLGLRVVGLGWGLVLAVARRLLSPVLVPAVATHPGHPLLHARICTQHPVLHTGVGSPPPMINHSLHEDDSCPGASSTYDLHKTHSILNSAVFSQTNDC